MTNRRRRQWNEQAAWKPSVRHMQGIMGRLRRFRRNGSCQPRLERFLPAKAASQGTQERSCQKMN
jgi:hypothetical protein